MGAGEIVGLLGPNGAGKTTTISCIAGLLRPDSGSVSICGVDAVKQGPAARLHLGIATQEVGLYLPLDAEQNLRFYAALAGVKKKQIDSCVSQTIERFGLGDLLGKAVGSLSAGQKRLVHVASAVVGAPSVLLLDEMTANLDVTVRHLLMESVREIAQEGCAILYSSHYLEEVEDLCSRVVILDRGAVIASGGIADLIGKHGGGCVEMVVDGQVLVAETMDLSEAIQSVGPTQRLQSARVIDSSLEAVFISLTGEPSQALFPERQEKARC